MGSSSASSGPMAIRRPTGQARTRHSSPTSTSRWPTSTRPRRGYSSWGPPSQNSSRAATGGASSPTPPGTPSAWSAPRQPEDRTMTHFELVSAADVRLMQGLAQRVTATRPDLVNSDASFGELAWIWGKGHASDGASWPRRLWFSGDVLVAWGWAYLPHQVRRSDGSVTNATGAYLGYQVHPDHAALVDEVIG